MNDPSASPRVVLSVEVELRAYWHQLWLQSTVTDAGADRLPAPSTAMTSIVFTTPRSAYRIAAVWPPPIGWSNRPFRKTS